MIMRRADMPVEGSFLLAAWTPSQGVRRPGSRYRARAAREVLIRPADDRLVRRHQRLPRMRCAGGPAWRRSSLADRCGAQPGARRIRSRRALAVVTLAAGPAVPRSAGWGVAVDPERPGRRPAEELRRR